MEFINKILLGNCKEVLKQLPDKSVRCCVTSPPYYGLRDYGTGKWVGGDTECDHKGGPMRTKENINKNTGTGNDVKNTEDHEFLKNSCGRCGAMRIDDQIGLEETPEKFIASLVEVFEEVKRVLTDDGTLWVNIGDSYAADRGYQVGHGKIRGAQDARDAGAVSGRAMKSADYGLKPKDLIGIPWMLAFALRSAGWYLRQDIIWHKPNPMPESVTDRCTKSHEYIFLLSKSRQYYYNHEAIKTPIQDASAQRLLQDIENQKGSDRVPGKTNGAMKAVGHKNMQRQDKNHSFHESRKGSGTDSTSAINGTGVKGHSGNFRQDGTLIGGGMANKRSVWTVTTKPYSEAHFATYPPELIVDCIKAGSEEGDVILDPFSGAGTTAMVARKLNRNFVAIELNQKYIDIANKRLDKELGMF